MGRWREEGRERGDLYFNLGLDLKETSGEIWGVVHRIPHVFVLLRIILSIHLTTKLWVAVKKHHKRNTNREIL